MENLEKEAVGRVLTPLNYHLRVKPPSKNSLPSMTIPDQSLTLQQLIDRHTSGMSLGAISKTPIFDEENVSSGINPATLDLVDIENMMRENASTIKSLKDENEKTSRAKAAARRQKEIDDEVEKREKQKGQPPL